MKGIGSFLPRQSSFSETMEDFLPSEEIDHGLFKGMSEVLDRKFMKVKKRKIYFCFFKQNFKFSIFQVNPCVDLTGFVI